ncbi:hypothetical protein Bbelb_160770 [Branchiostoma belcheri]|nr:hypothetical protein Bbelb_160770 [Branchiostoma belcheri]
MRNAVSEFFLEKLTEVGLDSIFGSLNRGKTQRSREQPAASGREDGREATDVCPGVTGDIVPREARKKFGDKLWRSSHLLHGVTTSYRRSPCEDAVPKTGGSSLAAASSRCLPLFLVLCLKKAIVDNDYRVTNIAWLVAAVFGTEPSCPTGTSSGVCTCQLGERTNHTTCSICTCKAVGETDINCVPPVHGFWSSWSEFSSCSVSCGIGLQTRYRACDNPLPSNNGTVCEGPLSDTIFCNSGVICTDCVDDNAECPGRALSGECIQNSGYMLVNCRHSCGVCTTQFLTGLIDCTFETDLCRWTQSTQDNFAWTRHHGATSSSGTGPSFDHTVGDQTGHYIYIETSSLQVSDKARLYSPTVYPTSSTMCLRFWYHMYGSTTNRLNVYIQTGSALPTIPTFQRTGPQGDRWIQAEVEVYSAGPYQVVMEGVHGTSFTGDIALDDITMSTGPCNTGMCSHTPCNATCTSYDNYGYHCTCKAGLDGKICNEYVALRLKDDIDECVSSPCGNGGVCLDRLNGYLCQCPRGYEGLHCETGYSDLRVSPCSTQLSSCTLLDPPVSTSVPNCDIQTGITEGIHRLTEPFTVSRMAGFVLHGEARLVSCVDMSVTGYSWTIFQPTTAPNPVNTFAPVYGLWNLVTNKEHLTVPKLTLLPGTYMVQFQVTILDQAGTSGVHVDYVHQTWLRVVLMPLGMTLGPSLVTRHISDDFWVNASVSLDPEGLVSKSDLNFIWTCETSDGSCLTNYVEAEGTCLKFSTDYKTYEDARTTCQAEGARLIVVKTAEMDSFLRDNIRSNTWIGLDKLSGNSFVRSDGSNLTQSDYQNWGPSEPTLSGFRTEVVLTTHGCPTFAHVFAHRQHADARTAGCDQALTLRCEMDACGNTGRLHYRVNQPAGTTFKFTVQASSPGIVSSIQASQVVVFQDNRACGLAIRCINNCDWSNTNSSEDLVLEAVPGSSETPGMSGQLWSIPRALEVSGTYILRVVNRNGVCRDGLAVSEWTFTVSGPPALRNKGLATPCVIERAGAGRCVCCGEFVDDPGHVNVTYKFAIIGSSVDVEMGWIQFPQDAPFLHLSSLQFTPYFSQVPWYCPKFFPPNNFTIELEVISVDGRVAEFNITEDSGGQPVDFDSLLQIPLQDVNAVMDLSSLLVMHTADLEKLSNDDTLKVARGLEKSAESMKMMVENDKTGSTQVSDINTASATIFTGMAILMESTSTSDLDVEGSNLQETTELNNKTVGTAFKAISNVLHMYDTLMAADGTGSASLEMSSLHAKVQKEPCQVGQKKVFTVNDVLFVVPAFNLLSNSCEDSFEVEVINSDFNPFRYAGNSPDVGSEVAGLTVWQGRDRRPVHDLPEPVDMIIPRDKQRTTSSVFKYTGRVRSRDDILLVWQRASPPTAHSFKAASWTAALPVPQDQLYTLQLQHTYNNTILTSHPYSWLLPPEALNLTESDLQNNTTFFLGVKYAGEDTSITVSILESACVYFGEDSSHQWEDDGCEVGPLSNMTHLHCRCDHLTKFAGFVPPNPIDFTPSGNILENPIGLILVLTVFGLFLLGYLMARKADRLDLTKGTTSGRMFGLVWVRPGIKPGSHRFIVTTTPHDATVKPVQVGVTTPTGHTLNPDPDCHYIITVYTGFRLDAGTTAQVSITVFGFRDESQPLALQDARRQLFQGGSVDSFLVSCENPLGPLTHIHVWHDNTGHSPAWYLSKVVIQHVSSGQLDYFICNKRSGPPDGVL